MSKGAIWPGFHHAQPFRLAEAAKTIFKEDLAGGVRKPWYHPYNVGFGCIICAEVVKSWWLPPRFQRTPGSRIAWAESLQAVTDYMMWENEAEDTVRILRNYIFQEHGIFTKENCRHEQDHPRVRLYELQRTRSHMKAFPSPWKFILYLRVLWILGTELVG